MKILPLNVFLSLFCLLIISCSSDSENNASESDSIANPIATLNTIENEVLQLINNHRLSEDLVILEHNDIAYEIALEHTNYMISNREIGHDNFSNRFDELSERLEARTAGENVASRYRTAIDVVEGWLNSSGHKANIEGDFTHTAIAIREDTNGHYYFTQLFYK